MAKFGVRIFAALFGMLVMATVPHRAHAATYDCSAAPAPAAQVGYCLNTFNADHLFDTAHVSMSTGNPVTGYSWYLYNCDGTTPLANVTMSGGVASLGRGGTTWGATLATVGCVPQPDGSMKWVGKAFGGGEYIAATIHFTAVKDPSTLWWPSVWAYSLKSMASGGTTVLTTWPNQPDKYYGYFPELDIFEYFMGKWNDPTNTFQQTLHAWYGEPQAPNNTPCDPTAHQMCQVDAWTTTTVSSASVFSSWHTVAALVVPATHTAKGYVNYYFDGALTGSTPLYNRWNPDLGPTPVGQNWGLDIIDADHVAVLLGGVNESHLFVDDVEVWQTSEAGNVTD